MKFPDLHRKVGFSTPPFIGCRWGWKGQFKTKFFPARSEMEGSFWNKKMLRIWWNIQICIENTYPHGCGGVNLQKISCFLGIVWNEQNCTKSCVWQYHPHGARGGGWRANLWKTLWKFNGMSRTKPTSCVLFLHFYGRFGSNSLKKLLKIA